MFGIGMPELILIMIIALLVVGPDKLPGLARTIAGYVVELKKAANSLKQSLSDEEDPLPWDKSPHDFTLPEGFSSAAPIVPEPDNEDSAEVESVSAPSEELSGQVGAGEEDEGKEGDDR